MKVTGNQHNRPMYKWGVVSPSDPNQTPLKYETKEQAEDHANRMNAYIEIWDENPGNFWNKEYWVNKPEPFQVLEL